MYRDSTELHPKKKFYEAQRMGRDSKELHPKKNFHEAPDKENISMEYLCLKGKTTVLPELEQKKWGHC